MRFLKFGAKQHDIHYEIKPSNPQAHYFTVKLQLAKPNADTQQFWMPAWIPGSYKIRDFSQFIARIKAYTKAGEVPLTQVDKNTWEINGVASSVTLEYEVYAYDLSVRGSYLDTTRGFFNGTCVFLAVKDQEQSTCSVDVQAPEDKQFKHWRVATSMVLLGAKRHGFGTYQAKDYDELIDHPVEMGEFNLVEFDVEGVPHEMAITGKHQADLDRIKHDLQKICTQQAKLFGGVPSDIKRYVFLTMVVGEGYGGLEHRSSCSLICQRTNLPHVNVVEAAKDYAGFLSLCSHEYFHAWNVKRIKPASFLPYDLNTEGYTKQLWVFEGFTSYYEDLSLIRAGVISMDMFFEMLCEKITRYVTAPAYKVQSVTDSSFCAWTKFYNVHSGLPNMVASYYTKGCLIAWCVDIYLRENTQQSLDTLMQKLWREYGEPLEGVPEGRVEEIILEMTGKSLEPLLQTWLYNTQKLPLIDTAKACGLTLAFESKEEEPKVELGIRLAADNQTIDVCFDGSCAQQGGLSANDKLLALDGMAIQNRNLVKILQSYQAGDKAVFHVFRNDELMDFEVVLTANQPKGAKITVDNVAAAEQKQLRENWLR